MLAKINRIKKKKDFEIIFKNGKSLKSGFVIFKVIKNNLGVNRFGFIVSKQVSKKATERNKARRRMANVARKEMENIKPGTDMVMIALPGIKKEGFSEIRDAIKKGLQCLSL